MNTIVMTGGTSGLGEVAARRFIQTPNTRLLLGARVGVRSARKRFRST
jgi:short-subunit dehydrogenase involved in D-alanine esterification of teichoic acids